jgi:hypothetical protein
MVPKKAKLNTHGARPAGLHRGTSGEHVPCIGRPLLSLSSPDITCDQAEWDAKGSGRMYGDGSGRS